MTRVNVVINKPDIIFKLKNAGPKRNEVLRRSAEPLAMPHETCSIGKPSAFRDATFDWKGCSCIVTLEVLSAEVVNGATFEKMVNDQLTPKPPRRTSGKI